MKKIIFGIACIASVVGFFFGYNTITPEKNSDLTVKNIEAVRLSASETVCEGTNQTDCYIYNNNGVAIGKSKGPLRHWD